MLNGVLEIIFPRFCLGCGKEGLYICKDCETFLTEVENTGNPFSFSLWEHEGLIEQLFYKIKIEGKHHIIEEVVRKVFEKIELCLPKDTAITYVPMFKKKQRERGFNQSELIANSLGKGLIPKEPVLRLLEKTKDSFSQPGFGLKASEENIRGTFRYCGQFVPENVLLVDDIFITGATTGECAKVLKRRGVKNVWVFTISRKTNI